MTLNGVMALIMRYFTEFVCDVVVKISRSLSHLLMSFLFVQLCTNWQYFNWRGASVARSLCDIFLRLSTDILETFQPDLDQEKLRNADFLKMPPTRNKWQENSKIRNGTRRNVMILNLVETDKDDGERPAKFGSALVLWCCLGLRIRLSSSSSSSSI